MVMDLRSQTGAAMMLCKEALQESNGDFEEAVVYIRKKLKGKLEGASERSAAEGVTAVVVDGSRGAIVELNSETDFVARNDDFKALAKELAEQVLKTNPATVEEALTQSSIAQDGATVQDRVNDVYTKLRERIVFKRFEVLTAEEGGALAGYVHVPSNDKIGVLIELGGVSGEAGAALGRELAMHIAAAKPKYLSRDEVPARLVEQEQNIARDTAIGEGKPEAAIPKIVEGRLRKFYEEVALLDQLYVRDSKKSVTQVLKEAGDATIRRFVRYTVGEEVKENA
jgi:elongation factor Ts